MRRPLIAFAAVLATGLVVLVALAAGRHRAEAFSLGVTPSGPAAKIEPRSVSCQRPVYVPDDFSGVRLGVGTFTKPGIPFDVDVRDARTHATLGHGSVAPGYADSARLTARVGTVGSGRVVEVCVTNRGASPIVVYGNKGVANRLSANYLDGRGTGTDMSLVFMRPEPKSLLALVPSIVSHASVFHGGFVGRATMWLLLVLMLAGLPLLAGRAVWSATREPVEEDIRS